MSRTASASVLHKQRRGIELQAAGRSYDQIADELGYANRGSAWRAVDRGLRAEPDGLAGEYLETQTSRYEAILAAWWERGTSGHEAKAANILLRTLERLDRLLRLTEAEASIGQETLVISPDPETYARQLREIAEERGRGRSAQA